MGKNLHVSCFLHTPECVGTLEGGARHLGTPPSQMPCLAQRRFLFCSEKAVGTQTHATSQEELYFIPKSVTFTAPTPFPSSKKWSVMEGMPSSPCYVSCTLPEEPFFIPIRRCREILGSPKDSGPSKVTISHSIQTFLCSHPLSHSPRSRPESLSEQNHYLKAQACYCSSVLKLLCIWSNFTTLSCSSRLCTTD